jgi:hypothetical protein
MWLQPFCSQFRNFGNILFSAHIPVLSRGIELLEEVRYISLNNEINHALLTASLLLERFCKLLFLTTACPQTNIPWARMEGVLFPNLVCSAFMQWLRLFQWIRAISISVWELNGEKCRVLSADCMWYRPYSLLANEERK